MSDFDVPPFEMDDNSPSELDIEAVLNGDVTAESSPLHEYFGGLRHAFETSADVPAGAALAEFIEVVDLTTTAGAPAASGKKHKMITGIGTFIATTTGKIVLGTTVAAASVGGVHAVDLVDVPGLPDAPTEVVEVEDTTSIEETIDELIQVEPVEDHADLDESANEEPTEENEVVSDDAEQTDDEATEGEDTEGEDGDLGNDEPENHGESVSDFANSTDLEGCERGQAISALARSNGEAKRQDKDDAGDDGAVDESTGVDEESTNKCKTESEDDEAEFSDGDTGDDSDGSDDSADSDDDQVNTGKGEGKGKGKGHQKNKLASDDNDGD